MLRGNREAAALAVYTAGCGLQKAAVSLLHWDPRKPCVEGLLSPIHR